MNTPGLYDQRKSARDAVQTGIDELNLKVALGSGDLKRMLEREWMHVQAILERQSNRIRRRSDWADTQLDQIQAKLILLKDLLRGSSVNSERKFDIWKSRVVRAIHHTEFLIHEIYGLLDEDEQDLMSELRVRMEVYLTHLSMSKHYQPDLFPEERQALIKMIDETMIWRDQEKEQNMLRMQRFREQLQTSFAHLREAFIELSK